MKNKNVTNRIYGAYGSNLDLKQMAWRCPGGQRLITGYVNDYRLTFRRGGYANIEPSKGDRVPVLLWEISQDNEKALDRYEGFPHFYIKVELPVETCQGAMKAMFYIMADQYATQSEKPKIRYYSTLYRGYVDNCLPLKYLKKAIEENESELGKF